MIKHPFTARELSNTHLYAMAGEIGRIVRELDKELGLGGDGIILEDFGTALKQRSWTDETGYYVTFRPHPLYSHMPKVKDALKEMERRFLAMFPPQKTREVEVSVHEPSERNSSITVSIITDSYSIGD